MKTTIGLLMLLLVGNAFCAEPRIVWLDELDTRGMHQDWREARKRLSVEGNPITIAGERFERGVGTHAQSKMRVNLAGGSTRFTAKVGVDSETASPVSSVQFKIIGDGKTLFQSAVMKIDTKPASVDIDLTGLQSITLLVDDAGDGINFDHADWADAKFTVVGAAPDSKPRSDAPPAYILTPRPPAVPRFTGAKVFGVRPGNPILFRVTATGEKPIAFSADGLPAGALFDSSTGILSGSVAQKGEFSVRLKASNSAGSAERTLKLVVGDRIALTPPMGWNSWNCWAAAIDDAKVRAAADAMEASGLIDHGWTYVNIDDCWEIKPGSKDPLLSGEPRDKDGYINTNKKFPDMKALTDYIHAKGLKAGLYSSPGPLTCAKFVASYQYEEKDAQRWADWGFDYIKYDWCSYGTIAPKPDLAAMKKPYQVMRDALSRQKRDIVFSLCQYGMGKVWEWGDEVGGNCWRTTGDITDTWNSMSRIGFAQDGHEKFAKPGCWNDPDMLVVGKVGWSSKLHPTRLSADEQYTHISLWCLLSSPLLIGCDMTQLDDFTLSLLTNDEVLAVNQDPLGKPAGRIARVGSTEIWARDLEDGSKAVGLFNCDDEDQVVQIDFAKLGLSGRQPVRDLWRQKDLGEFEAKFESKIPWHGVMLIQIGKKP